MNLVCTYIMNIMLMLAVKAVECQVIIRFYCTKLNYVPAFCYVLTMFIFLHAGENFFYTCCVIKRFVTS